MAEAAQFDYISETEAPLPSAGPVRREYFERYVSNLEPGVVGRIPLGESVSAKQIGRGIHGAAKRLGIDIRTWTDRRYYYVVLSDGWGHL